MDRHRLSELVSARLVAALVLQPQKLMRLASPGYLDSKRSRGRLVQKTLAKK